MREPFREIRTMAVRQSLRRHGGGGENIFGGGPFAILFQLVCVFAGCLFLWGFWFG
jgi:hypothetical protein